MMKRKKMILIGITAALMISGIARAQAVGSMSSRSGHWSLGGGMGFTVDPDLYGIQLGADYYITNEVAVSPLFIGAINGNDNLWGLSGQVKYSAQLAENNVVRPYGHIGIGFINLELEDFKNGNATTRYLFPVGGGFEFELNDELSLDTNVLFIVSEVTSAGLFIGVRHLF
jgi:opacity protein-like surface antigen